MKNLFSDKVLKGLLVLATFGTGAVFGQYVTIKQWETIVTDARSTYEEGLDTLSDLVNNAYDEDVVTVSQREDGSKLYTINASKINHKTIKTSTK